ncbi:DUF5753 domain-containing protein [Lentzea sp. NPDC051838]|uniref:DUF5753 domain-containing protein n=1 Tax=Lentzea sp. NPDC051838 TaxID=3154849 RepID=UPI00341B9E6B
MRKAIANSGMSARELADLFGWDDAKISHTLTGRGGVSLLEVAMVLGACRESANERDRLLDLFPARDLSGWWQVHGECMPVRSHTAFTNLAAAETLIGWHTHAVPVLLRTAEYMRELLVASATVPADEVEERLCAMQEMQQLLGNDLESTFYIHELALDLQVGGREAHIGQLQHLMFMANWTRIRILVVPAAAGAHAGVAGPFTQLKFPKYEPLVLVETENSSLFVEAKEAVGGYDAVVCALDRVSLDEDKSLELISRRCVRLQEVREEEGAAELDTRDVFPPQ